MIFLFGISKIHWDRTLLIILALFIYLALGLFYKLEFQGTSLIKKFKKEKKKEKKVLFCQWYWKQASWALGPEGRISFYSPCHKCSDKVMVNELNKNLCTPNEEVGRVEGNAPALWISSCWTLLMKGLESPSQEREGPSRRGHPGRGGAIPGRGGAIPGGRGLLACQYPSDVLPTGITQHATLCTLFSVMLFL